MWWNIGNRLMLETGEYLIFQTELKLLITFISQTPAVFQVIEPYCITPSNLVDVQMTFAIVKVSKGEFVFLPKLYAICMLDHSVKQVSFCFI